MKKTREENLREEEPVETDIQADDLPEESSDIPADGLEAQCEELREKWLRSEAELQNFRRRAQRDMEEAEARARERVLAEVMSIADDLERALDAAEERERSGPIFQGVQLVHGRVRDILSSHGVDVIDPVGKPFDPHESEAMLEVESDEFSPGVVVNVIEKGYRQGDRLLRPAKVTVSRGPSGATKQTP